MCAVQRELLDRNVAHVAHARLARAGGTTARVWSAAELGVFLAAARSQRLFPKTRTSRRCIDLDKATVGEISRWRRQVGRDGMPSGIDDWMFCNASVRFLNPESVSQLFSRVMQRTALPRIRFDLRHTHASLLIAAGVPIKVVSERLGHAHSPSRCIPTSACSPGMSAAAADQFAALITAASRYNLPAKSRRNTRSATRRRANR